MKFAFGDAEIYYETFGAGRPLVLLPGQPSNHLSLARFIEPVFAQRAGWQRIYLDLPGTGQSTGGEAVATPDKLLDAMLAFIDALHAGGAVGWRVSGAWRAPAPRQSDRWPAALRPTDQGR
jgi:pimeloyl-ACP methyl ester carboxylesterase